MLRGLAGDFTTMPLKEVVVYLWERRLTGTLTLERDAAKKSVVIENGHIINANSNLPIEFLGQFLINLGHISEEQFQRAFETQKETKVFLGRILVMIGLVKEATVATVLALKFRETLLEPFSWPGGNFTFDRDRCEKTDGVDIRIPLSEILKESEFRTQAWEQIRRAFPSGECTLELVRENLVEQPKHGSIDEKIFSCIELGQTLEEMALGLHATDYFLYQRLFAFHKLGAIKVRRPQARIESSPSIVMNLGLGDSPSPEQLLENARAFFGQGNFRDAYSVARRSQQLVPTLEVNLLMKQIEAAWLPQLRVDYLGRRRSALVDIDGTQVAALPLTAPERYLLSRFDGKKDVESILRVAPLREFEALTFLDRFVAQRWVRMI